MISNKLFKILFKQKKKICIKLFLEIIKYNFFLKKKYFITFNYGNYLKFMKLFFGKLMHVYKILNSTSHIRNVSNVLARYIALTLNSGIFF